MRHLVPSALWLIAVAGCGALPALPEEVGGPSEDADDHRVAGDGDGDVTVSGPDAGPPEPPFIESCFAAGTPIATPSGEQAIETLTAGELVWAFDIERGERVARQISAVHAHPATSLGRLIAPDGRELLVTDNHPIYARDRGAFVPAREIERGEALLTLGDASPLAAASASAFVAEVAHAPVFNITVEGAHTYFAAGVLVHNKQPPPCPTYDWSTGTGCNYPPWPPEIEACFAPGTPIATPSGERAIESLRVGDAVWGFDTERGVRVESRVTAVQAHAARPIGALELPNGTTLFVTGNHPFYDAGARAYVPARELTHESTLLAEDSAATLALQPSAAFRDGLRTSDVHNITVAGVHNYFAGGVLVHNKQPPPCPTYNWESGEGCEHPVVDEGPSCEPYPAPALDAAAYVARVNGYLFAIHDPTVAPVTLNASLILDVTTRGTVARNDALRSMFVSYAELELGSVVVRWLRVPTPAAPSRTGTLEEQLYWQLASNLGRMVARYDAAPLAEMLSYTSTVYTDELHALYPLNGVVLDTDVAPFPPERAGALTEIAFLRAHPTPTARGRVLDELLLCGVGNAPWAEHDPLPPPAALFGTRYDGYAQLANTPGCADCHGELDRLGLALELFDETGAYRTTDQDLPVTPNGVVEGIPVTGASALGVAMTMRPAIEDCVARSLLTDALGRLLTPDDECSVSWVIAGMRGVTDMRGALLSVVTSPAFRHEPLGSSLAPPTLP